MKINYFTGTARTLEELKKEYKQLAKKYHPDITGRDTNKEMAEINNEYQYLFDFLKNMKFNHQTNDFYESDTETKEQANEFINIINAFIKYQDIDIMVCGSWLWITGKTYPLRNELKKYNLRFSSNKKAWYIHYDEFKKRSKTVLSLDEIKNIYGAEYFKDTNKKTLLIK